MARCRSTSRACAIVLTCGPFRGPSHSLECSKCYALHTCQTHATPLRPRAPPPPPPPPPPPARDCGAAADASRLFVRFNGSMVPAGSSWQLPDSHSFVTRWQLGQVRGGAGSSTCLAAMVRVDTVGVCWRAPSSARAAAAKPGLLASARKLTCRRQSCLLS